MDHYDLLSEIREVIDSPADELQLKATLISLNVLESDLIQLGLIENAVKEILEIRLDIQNRLGWFISH